MWLLSLEVTFNLKLPFTLLDVKLYSNKVKCYFVANRNMFDKPNKDAFYIVTHFLLERLNPARFNETYR